MTRIAFLDVDGTIAEHGSTIAPSTVTAIRRARENGHLVWLCTGRADGDIHPDVRAIGFDGAISNAGAYATRGDDLILEHPLLREDVAAIETYFGAHDIHYFLQSHEAVFASPGIEPIMREYVRERLATQAADLAARGFEVAPTTPVPRARPLSEVDRDRVAKAVFISPVADTVAHAGAELGDRFHVIPGSIPLPGGSNGEIGLADVTKGSAILEVLEHLGLDRADAIGIGDSWNDVEMFQVVGTPVAMGNAPAELQRLAGRVTTAVLDDGVHNAFAELGLL